MDRRVFVQSLAIAVATPGSAKRSDRSSTASPIEVVDHLIYATPDLDQGVRHIETLTGLVAKPGGTQPGQGVHNALVGLGPTTYLEIRAPDPAQNNDGRRSAFFDRMSEFPRLFRWAAKSNNLDEQIRQAVGRGVVLGEVQDGQRQTPAGPVVTWRMTDPRRLHGDGLVPFFIDWGKSRHPARGLSSGARLVALHGEHPKAPSVTSMLSALNVPMHVASGAAPRLIATIECPRGFIEIS